MFRDYTLRSHDRDIYNLTRVRKILLTLIMLLSFINVVLVVNTIIRPTPLFGNSGVLFTIELYQEAPRNSAATSTSISTSSASTPSLVRRSVSQLPTVAAGLLPSNAVAVAAPWKRCRNGHSYANTKNSTDVADDCLWGSPVESSKPSRSTSASKTVIQTSTPSIVVQPQNDEVGVIVAPQDPRIFVLWIGCQGICMKNAPRRLLCTGSSLAAKYTEAYDQSGLSDTIKAILPKSASGAVYGLVVAGVLTALAILSASLSLAPVHIVQMGVNEQKPIEQTHQVFVAITGMFHISALITLLVCIMSLRMTFNKSVTAIRGLDPRLVASLGTAFDQLYAVLISVGVQILWLVIFVIEDFRFTWWSSVWANRSPFAIALGSDSSLDFSGKMGLQGKRQGV